MKAAERAAAMALRRQGYSVGQIAGQLGVSKSAVSLWVRQIELTDEQIALLRGNGPSRIAGRELAGKALRRRREDALDPVALAAVADTVERAEDEDDAEQDDAQRGQNDRMRREILREGTNVG